ncbi:hypothetical protein DP113_33145 (plasmid) [Brasilonema octagenarum UFV-E1]|uniref:DUF2808 domain-containing protein n=1 Tax=Brasilonema sennae CENA114 TaxID=415709 RepID=A0A856MR10_9CYAN|nr:DUF2808 domain-containing protein [Brasilonema sennae]QDL12590.1 hypothetical protein DP114_33040 [Brasilonema sennae CENA114]QDL18985.1 hypothetical protein DP113_33145 [Brasilonema octagenarum UFV-E1]
MKKIMMCAVVLALATTALIPVNYANASADDSQDPHIDGNAQFPPTRWHVVRHTFRVHIPKNSKEISQLSIQVPTNITLSNDVDDINVEDKNGRKINTNVSVNDKTILLAFTEPVTPDTQLEIDLKNVKRRTGGNSYFYRLFAKFAGASTEVPIGGASFRIGY